MRRHSLGTDQRRLCLWKTCGLILGIQAFVLAEEAQQDSVQHDPALQKSARVHQRVLQAAARRRSWLKRRRQFTFSGVDYGLTGLPFAYSNPNRKWKYGGRLHLTDYSSFPFRYKITLNWSREAGEKPAYSARLIVPQLGETGWGLYLRAGYSRGTRRYYGQGNSSAFDECFLDPHSDRFRDERYYDYVLDRSRVSFHLLREIWYFIQASVGIQVEQLKIRQPGSRSLLFEEAPYGVGGGQRELFRAALRWDTRDALMIPREGTLHEWAYETPLRVEGFGRFTFTDIRYRQLSGRFNLANRIAFGIMHGTVPVDVYGDVALGGNNSLRGYGSQRFADDVRFLANSELRCRISKHTVLRQYLEWHGVVFVDFGRVWPALEDLEFTGMHLSGGGGIRLYWDEDFVIRLEASYSSERSAVGLLLRNIY